MILISLASRFAMMSAAMLSCSSRDDEMPTNKYRKKRGHSKAAESMHLRQHRKGDPVAPDPLERDNVIAPGVQ